MSRMDELTRVIEDELIAEQYNMMPSMSAENTVYAEFGLTETSQDRANITNTESQVCNTDEWLFVFINIKRYVSVYLAQKDEN